MSMEYNLDPSKPHHVWVKIPGYMMSEAAQDQRDAMAEWFLRQDIDEYEMDSVFMCRNDQVNRLRTQATHMVFAFDDVKKATLFKLAWGEL